MSKKKSPIEELFKSLDDETLEGLGQYMYDARLSVLRQYKKEKKKEEDDNSD